VRADLGDAGVLLDATAKAAYRARLAELRAELEEAEGFNDPARAAKARQETEFLVAELARAVGLGGRDRRAASRRTGSAERRQGDPDSRRQPRARQPLVGAAPGRHRAHGAVLLLRPGSARPDHLGALTRWVLGAPIGGEDRAPGLHAIGGGEAQGEGGVVSGREDP
jgi:hypothetical protein